MMASFRPSSVVLHSSESPYLHLSSPNTFSPVEPLKVSKPPPLSEFCPHQCWNPQDQTFWDPRQRSFPAKQCQDTLQTKPWVPCKSPSCRGGVLCLPACGHVHSLTPPLPLYPVAAGLAQEEDCRGTLERGNRLWGTSWPALQEGWISAQKFVFCQPSKGEGQHKVFLKQLWGCLLSQSCLLQGCYIPGFMLSGPVGAPSCNLGCFLPQDDNRYHEDIFGVTLRTYEVTNRLRSESIAFIEESKKDTDE